MYTHNNQCLALHDRMRNTLQYQTMPSYYLKLKWDMSFLINVAATTLIHKLIIPCSYFIHHDKKKNCFVLIPTYIIIP